MKRVGCGSRMYEHGLNSKQENCLRKNFDYIATQNVSQMKSDLKHVSFRLPIDYIQTIRTGAKANKVSQTQFIQAVLDKHNVHGGLEMSKYAKTPKLAKGGSVEIPDDDMKVLKNLGVATVFGIGGYMLTGAIREHFKKDENQAQQMMVGLLVGLFTLMSLTNENKG